MNSRFKLVVVTSSTFLVVLLLLGAAVGHSASPDDAYRHLSVYTEVLSRIKSEYVEEPDIKNVTLGAMNGMLEAIDPFASYLSADQYKQYLKSATEKKAGVGMTLSRKFGYVGVVNVLPGSSAWRSGLTTGDMLESIGGVATRDMPLAYAEMLLTGEPGSNVDVSVLRVRKPEPQTITLTRSPTRYPSVTSKMLTQEVGLVHAPALNDGRVKEVAAQLDQLQKQGAKKFILDLRFSGFGTPQDGIALADLFLDTGTIAYVQGQKHKRQDFPAEAADTRFRTQPLVVITNRGTANAAEIAAAALLDAKRAEVVGEKTYGDAAIRKAITMDDGSAVILAVAKYYSPSGKQIMEGVTPSVAITDVEPIVETDEEIVPGPPEPKTLEDDLLLKKAIEVIEKGKTQVAGDTTSTPDRPRSLPEKRETLTIKQ